MEKNELSQKINRQINSPLSELGRGHLGLTAFKSVHVHVHVLKLSVRMCRVKCSTTRFDAGILEAAFLHKLFCIKVCWGRGGG